MARRLWLATWRRTATVVLAALLVAGCAAPARVRAPDDAAAVAAERQYWSGRLALTVASEPPQSFSAGYELSGNAQAGQLGLTSPLGSTLAVLRWAPGEALLQQGEQTTRFDSLASLTERVTGAALPISALFAWLRGDGVAVDGWRADVSRVADGRLLAQRLQPLPTAELRLVVDDAP